MDCPICPNLGLKTLLQARFPVPGITGGVFSRFITRFQSAIYALLYPDTAKIVQILCKWLKLLVFSCGKIKTKIVYVGFLEETLPKLDI